MTTVRLAAVTDAGALTFCWKHGHPLHLLVSYEYYSAFKQWQTKGHFIDWQLDSGAFSAWNAGRTIDLQEYTEFALERAANDPRLVETFALDVIGDHEASARNTEEMWRQGARVIPTFHPGEPWDALLEMAAKYPKIALGGVVGMSQSRKDKFIEQVFARVWPKPIHGLGINNRTLLLRYPFHSVDASNWELSARAFGAIFGSEVKMDGTFKVPKLHLHSLWWKVYPYIDMQALCRARWRKEMAALDADLLKAGWKWRVEDRPASAEASAPQGT